MEIHHTNRILPIVFARPAKPFGAWTLFSHSSNGIVIVIGVAWSLTNGWFRVRFDFASNENPSLPRLFVDEISAPHIYIRSAFDAVSVTVSDERAKVPVRDIDRAVAVQMSHPPVTIECWVSLFFFPPMPSLQTSTCCCRQKNHAGRGLGALFNKEQRGDCPESNVLDSIIGGTIIHTTLIVIKVFGKNCIKHFHIIPFEL